MPTFEEVGNALKRKYLDGAVKAEMHKRRRRLRHVTGKSIRSMTFSVDLKLTNCAFI